jgi:hypothetical protein
MMSALALLLGCVLAVLVLIVVASCVLRANRLDRLHVRTDSARAALFAALDRRAVVARSVALLTADASLRAAATRVESSGAGDREAAENDLSRRLDRAALGRLPAALLDELRDAEKRVVLARRVYNDAVRDTLSLRSRRLVRWLHLAGTAPAPGYFEIAEPERVAGHRGEPGGVRRIVS